MKLKVGDQVWYRKGVHIITWISVGGNWCFLDGVVDPIEIMSLKKYRPKVRRK